MFIKSNKSKIAQTAIFTATLISFLGNPYLINRSYAQNHSQQTVSSSNETLQKILKNEDWKAVARVAEKVIRANGLDEYPWRMLVVDRYRNAAYASDINLVTIYSGLIEKIRGDDAALAFIIGHELAHHTKKHASARTYLSRQTRKKLQAEAEAEVEKLIAKEKQKYKKAISSCAKIENSGEFSEVCQKNRIVDSDVYRELSFLDNQGKIDPKKVEKKKREIFRQKRQAFEGKLLKGRQLREFEADRVGYIYMVKAGYDPQGALRALDLLARNRVPEPENRTHPVPSDRIEAVKRLMKRRSSIKLALNGAARLDRTKPLTFDMSKDGKSLLINSRFGS
ncbi:MAG: M48 family metallopeptidase [Cyanobacteria bacterium P01_A01_bin.45]